MSNELTDKNRLGQGLSTEKMDVGFKDESKDLLDACMTSAKLTGRTHE